MPKKPAMAPVFTQRSNTRQRCRVEAADQLTAKNRDLLIFAAVALRAAAKEGKSDLSVYSQAYEKAAGMPEAQKRIKQDALLARRFMRRYGLAAALLDRLWKANRQSLATAAPPH